MASLYEIDQGILNCIDAETGEVVDFDKLTELQMEREAKLEGIAQWIKNLTSDAAAYKAEKDVFAEREKAAKARADKLSEWLAEALQGEKMKTATVEVTFRKSEAVKIVDLEAVPDAYIVETITESPDKIKIKDALKRGIEIPGCELEVKNNIKIK